MKLKFVPFIAFIFISSFWGCKKGENDPLFSLRTRTNRLSGTWELKKAEWIKADTTTYFENGLQVEQTPNNTSDSLPTTIIFEFESNGNYSIDKTYNYPDDFFNNGSIAYEFLYFERGIWNFAGGKNDIPSKSQLVLIKEYSEEKNSIGGADVEAIEIENPTNGFIYNIKELRNDKLVLYYSSTMNTEDGAIINSAELTFEKL